RTMFRLRREKAPVVRDAALEAEVSCMQQQGKSGRLRAMATLVALLVLAFLSIQATPALAQDTGDTGADAGDTSGDAGDTSGDAGGTSGDTGGTSGDTGGTSGGGGTGGGTPSAPSGKNVKDSNNTAPTNIRSNYLKRYPFANDAAKDDGS